MLKVAQYAAELEDYDKAIQIYESIASSCLDSSLLKYSAKEYMFRAGLCHMSVDLLNAQHALEKYNQQYPAFQDSRECKLIKVIVENWLYKFLSIYRLSFFFSRPWLNISKSRTLMDSLKQSRISTASLDWINGTRQFYWELKSSTTTTPICDKFLKLYLL